MLETLQFIFSSFWVWAGTVILITACAGTIARWSGFILDKIKE